MVSIRRASAGSPTRTFCPNYWMTGLVFVGLSLNMAKILATPGLPGRAGEALILLGGTLLIALLLLVPHPSRHALGTTLLALSLAVWGGPTALQVRTVRRHDWQRRETLLFRVTLGQLATLPFLIAAVALLAGQGGALYWLVPGMLISLVAGMVAAWVLLIEILR